MLEALKKEFLEAPDEFTPFPFWFWNDEPREEEISRQLQDFCEKGVMGFVIHPRIGIPKTIEYLSHRFMELVRYAVEEAARLGMRVILYDEAMYPSGSAHGKVVQASSSYATRCLRFIEMPWEKCLKVGPYIEDREELLSVQLFQRDPEGKPISQSIVTSGWKAGTLLGNTPPGDHCSLVFLIESYSEGTIRGIHNGEDDGQPDAPPSADLLNPAAVRTFIELTYERYYQALRDYFGTTVIAMFTDEPDVLGRCCRPGVLPWTPGMLEWYLEDGGREADLPYLWLDQETISETIRTRFRRSVNRRLERNYYGQISAWCAEHHIALTGHPQKSDDIGVLRHFHIPGQDVVWRWVAPEEGKGLSGPDSTMAKCSSDAARHMGRRRNSNECFGCCGPEGIQWAFTPDDMKWYLDWMFVRGVNMLYPHAFFYSVEGEERYGERPPDVGPHNIWWSDYRLFSDYMKRMCWLMTDSVNTARIAVLCEENFLPWKAVKCLYEQQLEFNYLEQRLLLDGSCTASEGYLSIRSQQYRILLAESSVTLDQRLSERLRPFLEGGGRLMIYNPEESAQALVSAGRLPEPEEYSVPDWAEKSLPPDTLFVHGEEALLSAITGETGRNARITPPRQDLRVSHILKKGISFYLLTNEGESILEGDLRIRDTGAPEIWDAWRGACKQAACSKQEDGTIIVPISLQRRESMILSLNPSGQPVYLSRAEDSGRSVSSTPADSSRQAMQNPLSTGSGHGIVSGRRVKMLTDMEWHILNAAPCRLIPSKQSPILPPEALCISILDSWASWKGLEHFSGTITYTAEWEWDDTAGVESLILDLGEVHDTARLTINGRDAGVRLWAPYTYDISPYRRPGVNRISVEVTNSLANHLEGRSLPSGILGPVRLLYS